MASTDVDSRPFTRIEDLLQGFTVASAICVGAIWLFLSQFYSRFGLQPEQAGISVAYVVIRAEIAVAILLAITALIWSVFPLRVFLIRTMSRGREGDLARFHGVLLLAVLVQFAIGGTACFVSVHYGLHRSIASSIAWGAVVGIGVGVLLGVLLTAGSGYGAFDGHGARLGSISLRWIAMAFVLQALVCSPLVLVASITVAHSVHSGYTVTSPVISIPRELVVVRDDRPLLRLMRIPVKSSSGTLTSFCALLLGNDGSDFVLYVPTTDTVIHAPSDSTILTTTSERC